MDWSTRLIFGVILIVAATWLNMILLSFLGVYLVFTGIRGAAAYIAPAFRVEPEQDKWWIRR